MELFYIPVIIVVALFLLFFFLNLRYKKKCKTKKTEVKQEAKEEPKEEKTAQKVETKSDIQLTLRPDFSDLIRQTEIGGENSSVVSGGNLEVSKEILNAGNAYKRDYDPHNTDLSDEISNLSPELKAIVFGNILNEDR